MFCQILDHNYSRIFSPTFEVKQLLRVKHKHWSNWKKAFEFNDIDFIDATTGSILTGLVPHIQSKIVAL